MFLNTLTAEYKYSRRNMQTFTQQVETPFSLKKKNFFWIFYCVSEIYMKWRTFSKKKESLLAEVFPKLFSPKEVIT